MTTETNYNKSLGYRAHPAIANSDLKHLHDPLEFRANKTGNLDKPDTNWQFQGTMIDYYLLSRKIFHQKYVRQPDFETPSSPNQKEFLQLLLAENEPVDLITDDKLLEFHSKCYKKGDLQSAKDLANKLQDIVSFHAMHGSKQMVSDSDWEMLQYIEKRCEEKPLLNQFIFNPPEHWKVMKHLRIIGMEKDGVTWKGELDMAVIDFREKVIYNIDLKSSSDTIDSFSYTYINKYYYFRQQALYKHLLEWYVVENNIIDKEELEEEWTVKTRCIMVRTVGLHQAYMIPIPPSVIALGNLELQSAAQTIRFYDQHGWDVPKPEIVNDGLHPIEFDSQIEEFKQRNPYI